MLDGITPRLTFSPGSSDAILVGCWQIDIPASANRRKIGRLVFRLIQEVPAFTCLRASRARSTFLQMSWAVAVQLKGLEVSLCLAR